MRIPITISIFSAILVVALLLSASIVTYTHISYTNSALITASELMARSAEILRLRLETLIKPAEAIANRSLNWPDIGIIPDINGHPAQKRLISLLREQQQISSLYVGFEDGSLYQVGSMHSRTDKQKQKLSAPPKTVFVEWVILRDENDQAKVTRHFLDINGDRISSTLNGKSEYDPRTRPWYQSALGSDEISRTQVYLFSGSGKPGLTVSRGHGKSVFGVDITLDEVEEFLSKEPQAKDGILAIFRNDGPVFAKTAKSDADDKVLQELVDKVQAQPFFQSGTMDILGKPWIAHVATAPLGTETDEILALAMPVETIAAPIYRISRNTLLVSLMIIFASVPIIWLISRGLSRPLMKLAEEADSIRQFKPGSRSKSPSKIDEIQQLQLAMARMRSGVNIFGTYVPKALVRRLIERNEIPELGGERREITVLFMDMENFTAMSANLEPEEVMQRMSNYFEVATQTLQEHGATIDKYIGDAVMAFWNAPDETADHMAMACRAALAVKEAAKTVTEPWNVEGQPQVRTRIGLHCGEVIVGNVGSSDRMNYTALGATVNMASRLEGLNRDLKTTILVSAKIAHSLVERFDFQSAGDANLKGFDQPVEVLELQGELQETV